MNNYCSVLSYGDCCIYCWRDIINCNTHRTSSDKTTLNCVTATFYIRDLRIGNFRSDRITNQIGGYDSNSKLNLIRGVVVYVFNEVIIIITDKQ